MKKTTKTMTYSIEFIDNHIIIVENNLRLLLDTGSPITISNISTISAFGETVNTHQSIMGHTSIDDINRFVPNSNIDALIGADILSKISFSICLNNRLFEVNPIINHNEYSSFVLSDFMGIPIVNAMIDGKEIKFFLDTGAKTSYLNSVFVEGCNAIGLTRDFGPSL